MIIKTKNLTKKYGNLIAVNDVNIEITENQVFALLGLNGAGKTTLIKMLSCLITPTIGDAIIDNESILKNQSKIKQIINISPQETAIALNLTVLENLIFVAEIYGMKKLLAKSEAEKMIEMFKLQDKRQVQSKKLSGGLQKRLGIAMALITKPKILFLDEPTLGLDVVSRKDLWEIIKNLKKDTTIILTTHYLDEVENLADTVAIMKSGKIVETGTVKEITQRTQSKNFEDAFIFLNKSEVTLWEKV